MTIRLDELDNLDRLTNIYTRLASASMQRAPSNAMNKALDRLSELIRDTVESAAPAKS